MSEQWYINRNGQQYGPYSTEQMKAYAQKGELSPDDYIWAQGMAEWSHARNISSLFPVHSTPASPPPQPGKPKKKMSGLKIAAIIIGSFLLLLILLFVAIFSFARSMLRNSEVHEQAMIMLQDSQQAIELLGEPIESGRSVNGSINISNGGGEAEMTIPVSGPRNSGELMVEAFRSGGIWQYTRLDLQVGQERVNLLQSGTFIPGVIDESSEYEEPASIAGMKKLNVSGYGFTMEYPEQWSYVVDGNVVDLTPPSGSNDEGTTVRVQILITAEGGGMYENIDDLYRNMERRYLELDGEIYSYDEGTDFFGDMEHFYIVYGTGYTLEGNDYLEVVLIIERDSQHIYMLMHTIDLSVKDEFNNAMFESIVDSFRFIPF